MSNKVTYNEKLSHLSTLVNLAKADKDEKGIENKFIRVFGEKMGVVEDDIEKILSGELKVGFDAPANEVERLAMFHRLVLLMGVDFQVDEREVQFCRDMGIKLGLHPSAIEEILEKMKKEPDKILPPDEIASAFRKQKN